MQVTRDGIVSNQPPFGVPAQLKVENGEHTTTYELKVFSDPLYMEQSTAELFALHFLQHKKGLTGALIRLLLGRPQDYFSNLPSAIFGDSPKAAPA
jgi:hypothetical protein